MLSFINQAIGQRIKLHQNITGLSILLLGGIVAIFNVDNDKLVKTSWLLYSAGGFLIVVVLLCLFARIKLLEHLQQVVGDIEGQASNVYRAVRDLRGLIIRTNPPANEGEKAVAIDKLIAAENPGNLPMLGKTGEHGHKWASVLFGLALIQIALALLVDVHI
jgi:hypothetical protein